MKLLKTLMVMLPHHYPQLQPYGIWGESGTGGALTIVGTWWPHDQHGKLTCFSYAGLGFQKIIFLNCVNLCRGMLMRADAHGSQRHQISGAGVTGSYDLPYMGTRKQTWVLFKSSMCP